jgi:hypothetical protein
MRGELLVPPVASAADWPRRVASAVRYLLAVAEVPLAQPFEALPSAPASPGEGRTYYDTALHKVRTWDGSAWQSHW